MQVGSSQTFGLTLFSKSDSKQVEIAHLTNEDGIGIEQLEFVDGNLGLLNMEVYY